MLLRPRGEWDFPGGRIDDQELEEAAIREQKEETGMEISGPSMPLFACTSKWKDRSLFSVFLLWSNWQGEPVNMEPDKCQRLEWVEFEETFNRPLTEHAAKFLKMMETQNHMLLKG